MEKPSQNPPFPKILHLEDEEVDAELIRRRLVAEWPRCSIRLVRTREGFIEGLNDSDLDLILSDFSMPTFDGLSALLIAQRMAKEIPFIFLSGRLGEENAVRALQLGATDYLIKDRPARLVSAVRRALGEDQTDGALNAGLAGTEARFLQLADRSTDVFWFYSCEAGKRTHVSPAFERLWGVSAATLYADPAAWDRPLHPDDRAKLQAALEACLAGSAEQFDIDYRITGADGKEHWIADSGATIRNGDGTLSRICGVAKDVTALVKRSQSLGAS